MAASALATARAQPPLPTAATPVEKVTDSWSPTAPAGRGAADRRRPPTPCAAARRAPGRRTDRRCRWNAGVTAGTYRARRARRHRPVTAAGVDALEVVDVDQADDVPRQQRTTEPHPLPAREELRERVAAGGCLDVLQVAQARGRCSPVQLHVARCNCETPKATVLPAGPRSPPRTAEGCILLSWKIRMSRTTRVPMRRLGSRCAKMRPYTRCLWLRT